MPWLAEVSDDPAQGDEMILQPDPSIPRLEPRKSWLERYVRPKLDGMKPKVHHFVSNSVLVFVFTLLCGIALHAAESATPAKKLFLYSRYLNAEGETRYLPEGTYQDVLQRLRGDFNVRANSAPLTDASLIDVKVVLIANPSDQAVSNHPAPHHFSANDIAVLTRYVERGGGLIIMGNQENHNLEVEDTNKLLANFGLQFTNLYTDVKKVVLPRNTPLIGGLTWAYYTGNLLLLASNHPAQPRALVQNDLSQKPLNGPRNQPGVLLAVAQLGKGRIVAVTDAGWITNDVLADKGIGGVVITHHDNWEIFRRLSRWAAGAENLLGASGR